MARAQHQDEATAPSGLLEYHSSGLKAAFDRLREPRKHTLLDLGPPVEANVDFVFAQVAGTLYVEDFYRFLKEHPPPEEAPYAPEVFERLVASRAAGPFDLVLAWDLLSYLDAETVGALVSRLKARCRSGTLLFTVVSTAPRIPARPAAFRVLADGRVRVEQDTTQTLRNQRPTPAALERLMPGFRLLHSFLSQSGVQEYLLAHE